VLYFRSERDTFPKAEFSIVKVDYPPLDEPATADYVLDVLRDLDRQMWHMEFDQVPEVPLTFETTVAEWRERCDLEEWRALGRAANQIWQIDLGAAEWKSVLAPPRKRRLREVCELIAQHARRPRIRPATIFGRSCHSAGAFLMIRSQLHQAGAVADDITPSTPLAPFTRQHFAELLTFVSKVAPGALPNVRVERDPLQRASLICTVAGFACLGIGLLVYMPLLIIGGIGLLLASWLFTFVVAIVRPGTVEIGDLRTFRDLAKRIAHD
jgi:hypothetical protein